MKGKIIPTIDKGYGRHNYKIQFGDKVIESVDYLKKIDISDEVEFELDKKGRAIIKNEELIPYDGKVPFTTILFIVVFVVVALVIYFINCKFLVYYMIFIPIFIFLLEFIPALLIYKRGIQTTGVIIERKYGEIENEINLILTVKTPDGKIYTTGIVRANSEDIHKYKVGFCVEGKVYKDYFVIIK